MALQKTEAILSEKYGATLPHKTRSICPECKKLLDAIVFAENEMVFIKKTCPEHGEFKELYYESVKYYEKARFFAAEGKRIQNPNTEKDLGLTGTNCPMDCGLCARHKSHTNLGNIAVTNRCHLNCWYCFFFAKEGDDIYEPSLKQIRNMAKSLRNQKPVGCNALQLTGGEPCLREDIVDIVKVCAEEGFEHIQLNTTGIVFAQDLELAKKIRAAGSNTLYLSFDGVSPQTNPKNHFEAPYTIDHCRKADLGVVLVPTMIRGVNEQEAGDIVNFALNNMDVVRAVNFQPVSLVGRMPKSMREKQRITIPGLIKELEKQTNGAIAESDFFTVPTVTGITHFVEAFTGKPQYTMSAHFACGAATYVYKSGNKIIPITRFIDVYGLSGYLEEKAKELEKGKNKYLLASKILLNLNKFIDNKKKPKEFKLSSLLFNALIKHDYRALASLHDKLLLIGMMHFMDPYNYDAERVERCVIHYTMPDGRTIPFCAFNVLPEIYRDKVQKQFSIPQKEWEKKSGTKLKDLKYVRDEKKLVDNEVYRKGYDLFNYFGGQK